MATALLNVGSLYDYGPISVGDRYENIVKFDFDQYATNGCSLTHNQLGFSDTADPAFNVTIQSKLGYVFHYDHVSSKVLVYDQKDPAAAGGADIALPEVGNNVSLASLTNVRAVVQGRYPL